MDRYRAGMGLIMALLMASAAQGATPQHVEQSLARTRQWLYQTQSPDGSWELVPAAMPIHEQDDQRDPKAGNFTGRTALAIYALLASGEPHQQPAIIRAITWLENHPTNGTYALGIRCQVWAMLPQSDAVRAAMKHDAGVLLSSLRTQRGPSYGHFDYVLGFIAGPGFSHSRSQYGVLGLWAADQMGVEIPQRVWEMIEAGWLQNQQPDGGWGYREAPKPAMPETPGMTAAGVATLFITQDYLHSSGFCRGNVTNAAIEKGLQFLGAHINMIGTSQQQQRGFPYLTLYAFERVGVAAGFKYLGGVDWYQKGADWLIQTQSPDGTWSHMPTPNVPADQWTGGLVDACFATLFLSRGGAPVAINKLEYDLDQKGKKLIGNWTQRPRDAANATAFMGRQLERHLNWQIVNLKNGTSADLHDAPILYLAGNQELSFSAADEAKLKQYVEEGGLMLGNADCAAMPFTASFKKLAGKLFPAYAFRELPADHPIYTRQQFDPKKWKIRPHVLGLSNGVRELMILLPDADAGKLWQTRVSSAKPEMFQLATNLYLYATDKQKQTFKGDTHIVTAPAGAAATGTIDIARIMDDGNWNPEPGGWRRLAAIELISHQQQLNIQPCKPGEGNLARFKFAHWTGTTAVKLSDSAGAEIKKFIEDGGTLVVDAAGGSPAFAESAEKQLQAIFGPAALSAQPLPATHPALNPPGSPPLTIAYRDFARKVIGQSTSPRLRAIEINGRLAVVFSPDDLSAGMVGQNVDGIIGYDPATATEILSRLVSYAIANSAATTTQPTSK